MADLEQIGDTLNGKTEKLKSKTVYKCEVCGSDGHKTSGHGENGGARKGAGKPKGSKNEKTREREAILEGFRQRVESHADRLFNAQASLATGEQYLFVTITSTDKSGKSTRRTETVTDHETIKAYLDETLDNDDSEYYYLSTKPANNMAIDSLLNRAFGTPNKNIDLKSNGQTILDRMDETDVKRIALAMGEALSGTDDDTAE